jgi:predicted porin
MAAQAIWGQATQSSANGGFDQRDPNSARYDSPILAGFNGSIQYSAMGNSPTTLSATGGAPTNPQTGVSEGVPRSNSGRWALGGFYNNGPAQLGVVYVQNNSVRGTGLTDYAFSIAGGWQFTGFKLAGVWERLNYDATTSTDLKRDFWSVGATVNLGPGQMYASWGMAYDGKGDATDGTRVGQIIKGADTGGDQFTLTYTYPLSKRTLMYGGYVRVMNDDNTNQYTVNPNTYTGLANGADVNGFVLGTVHFF